MSIQDLSLAEIVTAKPQTAALFESFSLDFCCRGKQKLSEALANEPEKLSAIIKELETVYSTVSAGEINLDAYTLASLIDYILVNHHSYVKENIPVIKQHLDKVISKHGDKYPDLSRVKSLFDAVARDLENHMMKEELILFPRIKAMELTRNYDNIKYSVENPIHVMEKEHKFAGDLLVQIKTLTHNYTPSADACMTHKVALEELKMFENDLHKHVHIENNILFPKAIELEKLLNGTPNLNK
jgi:regulator of cell morphogenesis and NO signaling